MRKATRPKIAFAILAGLLCVAVPSSDGGVYARIKTPAEVLKVWDSAIHAEIVATSSQFLRLEELGPELREIGLLQLRVIDAQARGSAPAVNATVTAYYLKNTSATPKGEWIKEGRQVLAFLAPSRLAALPEISFISGENALHPVTLNASGKGIVHGALAGDPLLGSPREIAPLMEEFRAAAQALKAQKK